MKGLFVLALVAGASATATPWPNSTATPWPGVCYWTCSTLNAANTSGDGCMMASGMAYAGNTSVSACNDGYYPTQPSTTCMGGENYTVVCTNNASAVNVTTRAEFIALATAIGGGYNIPTSCTCLPGVTPIDCQVVNANSPSCTGCTIADCVRPGRQNVLTHSSGAICPAGVTTIAAAKDCFEQAACAGAIAGGVDVCRYGRSADCHTAVCPECPSQSKKGLLGLLGLLGLIPLLCCLLLCSLLLCCIRRRKVEKDVHFATFDGGAAPMAEVCAPVATVQEHCTVGPAVYGAPVGFGAPAAFGAPGTVQGAPFTATGF